MDRDSWIVATESVDRESWIVNRDSWMVHEQNSTTHHPRPTTHFSNLTTHDPRIFRGLAAALALCAGLAGPAAADFTFAAFGDTPYTREQEARFPDLIAAMNREPLSFVVHVGDFKAATAACSDEIYRQRKDWFGYFHHPFVFVPGDNDWADCGRLLAGRHDPMERLGRLRELFFEDEHSLGQVRLLLDRQPGYPEHSRWQHEGALFVTLNAPGPNNNARLMPGEFQARGAAQRRWLDEAFARATARGQRAVVILMQANPWVSPTSHYYGFRELLAAFAAHARRFPGEVLLVHGDTHRHRVDRPLRDPATRAPVANFTRVEVHGHPAMNWVRIRVREEGGRMRFEVSPGG